MSKITLKEERKGSFGRDDHELVISKSAVGSLTELLELFKLFAIACGYSINGSLQVVDDEDD